MEDIGKNLERIIREIDNELIYLEKEELFASGLSEQEIHEALRLDLHWNEPLSELYLKLSEADRKRVISILRKRHEERKKESREETKDKDVTDTKQHRGKSKREEREKAIRDYRTALRDKMPGKLLIEYYNEIKRLENKQEDREAPCEERKEPEEER